MGYALQLGAWSSVFAVPGALVDQYIKAADGDQLKVILGLLRKNGRSYSAEEIAAAVGLSGSRAESAVQFWVQNGLLQREDAPLATSLLPAAASAPAAAAPAQLVRSAPPRRMLRPDGVYISELVEPSPSIRRLVEEAEAMLAPVVAEVRAALGDYVYGVDVKGLEAVCFQLLKERNLTLSTAESCTGGRVAERITALPGVSSVYRGGVVSYWTSVKAAVLGVPQETLDQYGAVSEETARAMAEGARQITGADIAVSVTGVAGPDRDERDNPVGLVYIGLATPEGTFCRRTDSGRRRRDRIQELAANHALDVVRRYLTGLPIG